MNLQIALFATFSQELKDLWERFEEKSDCYFFQTYEWSSHWFCTIGRIYGFDPMVIVVYELGVVKMILPFAKIKKCGVVGIQWMGGIQTDYKGPLIDRLFEFSENDFKFIWQKIKTVLLNNDVSFCFFDNQPQLIGDRQNPFFYFFTPYRTGFSYSTKLPLKSESYFSTGARKKIVSDSRRQRKRLDALGDLSFVIADSNFMNKELTQTMILQKQRRFLDMNVRNILSDKHVQNFYTSFQSNFIQTSGLTLNDSTIATHWGIVFRKRFYYLMPSFEAGEISKYSGGRLLLEELIKWAIDNGCTTFDFTIGGEAYKKDWCESHMEINRSLIPLTRKGVLVCKLLQIKQDIIDCIVRRKVIMNIYRFVRKFIKR
jgi:CelD/BcsL family acetyltransferase involved in cellulose biosynthesis